MGRFYYDVKIQKIVYDVSFPEKQTLVLYDTAFYQMRGTEVLNQSKAANIAPFSIYHLALTNTLVNYGLDGSIYEIEEVKHEEGMVLTTWKPGKNYRKQFGKVVISVKDKKLFGIVFYNPEDVIVAKHFFEDYMEIHGIAFPGKMVKITYIGDTKSYEVTSYEDIILNNTYETYYYNYPVPVY